MKNANIANCFKRYLVIHKTKKLTVKYLTRNCQEINIQTKKTQLLTHNYTYRVQSIDILL